MMSVLPTKVGGADRSFCLLNEARFNKASGAIGTLYGMTLMCRYNPYSIGVDAPIDQSTEGAFGLSTRSGDVERCHDQPFLRIRPCNRVVTQDSRLGS